MNHQVKLNYHELFCYLPSPFKVNISQLLITVQIQNLKFFFLWKQWFILVQRNYVNLYNTSSLRNCSLRISNRWSKTKYCTFNLIFATNIQHWTSSKSHYRNRRNTGKEEILFSRVSRRITSIWPCMAWRTSTSSASCYWVIYACFYNHT